MSENNKHSSQDRASIPGAKEAEALRRSGPGGFGSPKSSKQAKSLLPELKLPQGGGALRGLGEKFAMNAATGSCSFQVPIATSPGRGGFDVPLSLSYDSGSGNGPFGLGWHLSTPSISRKTDKGLPEYRDHEESDTFVLTGAEDLVPVPSEKFFRDGFTVQRFRPRTEGLFARIERWSHGQDVHWRVTTKENILHVYGYNSETRIADPQDPTKVFSWLLEESRDDRGNVILYTYKAENCEGVDGGLNSESSRYKLLGNGAQQFLASAQRYLKRIQYGNRFPIMDRGDPVSTWSGDWLFEVVFDYGEHCPEAPSPDEYQSWPVRQDPFSNCRAGFDVRTYRLCRRVLMFHHFPELGPEPCLVKATEFDYSESPLATQLISVTQAGYAPNGSGIVERDTLPPLEFHYSAAQLHDSSNPLSVDALPGMAMALQNAQWVDLDGNGLPGMLLPLEKGWYFKQNLGEGRLGAAVLQRTLPSPANLGGGARLTDLDGDGSLELAQFGGDQSGYFDRTAEGDWNPRRDFRQMPNIDWDDPCMRMMDLTGDGKADLVFLRETSVVWYPSLGKEGFDTIRITPKAAKEADGPAITFWDPKSEIQIADMTGDGLPDIVRIRNGSVCYWPNLGHGRFGRQVFMKVGMFDNVSLFDPKRLQLVDLDGTGTSDIVYAGSQGISIYRNQSGNSFSEAIPITSLAPVTQMASLTTSDLMGNGTSCLIWSSPGRYDPTQSMRYVDLFQGKKPYVLERIVNNLGAETRVSYASSTKFFLEDRAEGRPWITRLPFPVQVVERVESHDMVSNSKLVTRYAYRHGYYDGRDREYRGFARVDQWDAETFCEGADELATPPSHTVTWFHTGAWLEKQKLERELAKEYYAGDAQAPLLADTGRLQEAPAHAGGSKQELTNVYEQREAVRALRGQMLRQELYGEDGSAQAVHPYVVKEIACDVMQYQKPKNEKEKGVTYAYPVNTLTLNYEREPNDPRMSQELVLDVDAWGNILLSASVWYPRRTAPGQMCEQEQQKTCVLVTENRYANLADEAMWYRIGVPIETKRSDLGHVWPSGSGLFAPNELQYLYCDYSCEVPYYDMESGGMRVIGHQKFYYMHDCDTLDAAWSYAYGYMPLVLGEVGERALPYKTLTLAYTGDLIDSLGYSFDAGGMDEGYLRDLEPDYTSSWADSGCVVLDPQQFFIPVGHVDPFSIRYDIRYDEYAMLPVESTDALGNQILVGERDGSCVLNNGNDYRVLAPALVTDANGNQQRVEYDALGRVKKLWRSGKYGTHEGDIDAYPGTVFVYDTHAWQEGRGPASVHVATREMHNLGGEPFVAQQQPVRQGFQHAKSWSDGFGREVMTKTQAEPGKVPTFDAQGRLVKDASGNPVLMQSINRWTGTGRRVFDNKGNPVKQYEPFFADSLRYETEKDLVERGVTPVFSYDSIGRLIRTDNPNGTHAEVRYGAWKQECWDGNDTVLVSRWYEERGSPDPDGATPSESEARAAWLAAQHAETSKVEHLDTQGRPFLVEEDTGEEPLWTWIAMDIEGNTRWMTDARGTRFVEYQYNMLGHEIRKMSADAGESWTSYDAKGKPRWMRDARYIITRFEYDELERLVSVWTQQGITSKLMELHRYGEQCGDGEQLNLRGREYLVYDGAGSRLNARCDFKGNEVEVIRRMTKNARDPANWAGLVQYPFVNVETLLESAQFQITTTFDALNRVISRRTPDWSTALPVYNEAGLLDSMSIYVRGGSPKKVIQNIDYNERGQREAIQYGNGLSTVYTYDPKTFRLTRQVSKRNGSDIIQDLTYVYDPIGNIVEVKDAISYGNNAVKANGHYEYDALYRLTKATGREHPGQQLSSTDFAEYGWLPSQAHVNDWQALKRYEEAYQYDAVGNILSISHTSTAGGVNSWTRRYKYGAGCNKLLATSAPGDSANVYSQTYSHDPCGNMTAMPHLPQLEWDHANRLTKVKKQVGGTETNEVCNAYDSAGQRVRKAYVHGGYIEERLYLGDYELYRKKNATTGQVQLERQTLHVMDGESRVSVFETKTIDTGISGYTPTSRERHQIANHLGSTSMELDGTGNIISYEEYHPYGTSACRAKDGACEVSAKRYRYTGKERDEETSLYYHGARYYAPWLGRWTSTDPAGFVDGPNLFAYCGNRPLVLNDPTGKSGTEPEILDFPEEVITGQAAQRSQGDPASDEGESMHPISTLTEELLLGGFHSGEPSIAGAIGQIGIGLIPIVGQAADIRDISADTLALVEQPSIDNAINLSMSLVGLLPLVGDAAKAALRLKKAVKGAKGLEKAINGLDVAEHASSRAARRDVMRQQGIPTSQQPVSQSRNASGMSYEYEVSARGGGVETKSVQHQTLDRSHPDQPHWEAGPIKTDGEGSPKMNPYGRPRLERSKSKATYKDKP